MDRKLILWLNHINNFNMLVYLISLVYLILFVLFSNQIYIKYEKTRKFDLIDIILNICCLAILIFTVLYF